MGTQIDHMREAFGAAANQSVQDILHDFWANKPYGKDIARGQLEYNFPIVATALANGVVPGMQCQWEQGAAGVEVVFEGQISINSLNPAPTAGTKVTILASIVDKATDLIYEPGANSIVRFNFADNTVSVQHGVPFFKAVALVRAAPGTQMTMHGHLHISSGGATTWAATLLGAPFCRMYAREVQ